MVARKTTGNPRRDDPKPRNGNNGKGGGLFTGLFIGLVIGLIVAAGLAWYLNDRSSGFKIGQEAPLARSKPEQAVATTPKTKTAPAESSAANDPISQPAAEPVHKPAPSSLDDAAPNAAKPRVDYTFYGILPGEKPSKQSLPKPQPPQSKDIWWLQVAALKNPADADKLKARLALLGLQVAMQKVESGGIPLYRIRTGPYQREDDALGDLDTLAANNYEPRLFKEPNPTPAASNNKEKP